MHSNSGNSKNTNSELENIEYVKRKISKLAVICIEFVENNTDKLLEYICQQESKSPATSSSDLAKFNRFQYAKNGLSLKNEIFSSVFIERVKTKLDSDFSAIFNKNQSKQNDENNNQDIEPEFTLVDISVVEKDMLIDKVSKKFDENYAELLSTLTLKLNILIGPICPAGFINPFRPSFIIFCLIDALTEIDIDSDLIEDIILSLNPSQSINLKPLYIQMNQILKEAGFDETISTHQFKRANTNPHGSNIRNSNLLNNQSDINLEGQQNINQEYSDNNNDNYTFQQNDQNVQNQQNIQGNFNGNLQRSVQQNISRIFYNTGQNNQQVADNIGIMALSFLQKIGFFQNNEALIKNNLNTINVGKSSNPDSSFQNNLDSQMPDIPIDKTFFGYLDNLQAGLTKPVDIDSMNELDKFKKDEDQLNTLRKISKSPETLLAPDFDQATVDILAGVFDYVFADSNIPQQIKLMITRLQIPVLKAAMIDRRFFKSADHPARKSIDILVKVGSQWNPNDGENNLLYNKIESVVEKIILNFNNDLSIFEEVNTELLNYIHVMEGVANNKILVKVKEQQEKEELEKARIFVDAEILKKIKMLPDNTKLEPFLTPFVVNQWREVLALSKLKNDNNVLYDKYMICLDQLIWSTGFNHSSQDRSHLLSVLSSLVSTMNDGLETIQWDSQARDVFTRRLLEAHMLAIRASKNEVKTIKEEQIAGKEAHNDLNIRCVEVKIVSSDDLNEVIASFENGMWFDFINESEKSKHVNYRLSWVSPNKTKFIFTNLDGNHSFVHTDKDVLKLLRMKQLLIIDQQNITERAFSDIKLVAEQKLINKA